MQFTIGQIQEAHSKVKTGADFPAYIRELKALGLVRYTTFVVDGRTIYYGQGEYALEGPAKFASQPVAAECRMEQFREKLKLHQQGGSDYPTFSRDAAECGIEKWETDLEQLTCTYFDRGGKAVLQEKIQA